jgi:hypothetical protein
MFGKADAFLMAMFNPSSACSCFWRATLLPRLFVFTAAALSAQDMMQPMGPGGVVRLIGADAAVLEAQDTRKDLPCTVTPVTKPILGFDMKFHAGYDVQVPLKELAGSENQLTMIFRITPQANADTPVYFNQHYSVPAIDENAGGPAYLQGQFNVGEGKYHVDFLMRDRAERICSSHWDVDANLSVRDKPMTLDITANTVQPIEAEQFKPEGPVERATAVGEQPLNVKVVVNFAPQAEGASTLQPMDTSALLSILRNIARDPRIGTFSVVAYNMQEQRILYRADSAGFIDFPALGHALNSLNLGTVDLKRLTQKHGDSEFLSKLISQELISTDVKDPQDGKKSQPDAIIFAGPKIMLDEGLPPETLKQLADVKFPVFYMNYNLNPQINPWRDAIGVAVKALKGAEFTIARPRDLFFSWSDIMGRIVKSRLGKTESAIRFSH